MGVGVGVAWAWAWRGAWRVSVVGRGGVLPGRSARERRGRRAGAGSAGEGAQAKLRRKETRRPTMRPASEWKKWRSISFPFIVLRTQSEAVHTREWTTRKMGSSRRGGLERGVWAAWHARPSGGDGDGTAAPGASRQIKNACYFASGGAMGVAMGVAGAAEQGLWAYHAVAVPHIETGSRAINCRSDPAAPPRLLHDTQTDKPPALVITATIPPRARAARGRSG